MNEMTMPYEVMTRMKDAKFSLYGVFAEGTYTVTQREASHRWSTPR